VRRCNQASGEIGRALGSGSRLAPRPGDRAAWTDKCWAFYGQCRYKCRSQGSLSHSRPIHCWLRPPFSYLDLSPFQSAVRRAARRRGKRATHAIAGGGIRICVCVFSACFLEPLEGCDGWNSGSECNGHVAPSPIFLALSAVAPNHNTVTAERLCNSPLGGRSALAHSLGTPLSSPGPSSPSRGHRRRRRRTRSPNGAGEAFCRHVKSKRQSSGSPWPALGLLKVQGWLACCGLFSLALGTGVGWRSRCRPHTQKSI
jgi:hypothetical protein